MSVEKASATRTNLVAPPIGNNFTIPTRCDGNNYIVIDHNFDTINCIYKYNINTDKWININGVNNIINMKDFSAALNVNKQILFLFHYDSITQIQLNNSNINNIINIIIQYDQ